MVGFFDECLRLFKSKIPLLIWIVLTTVAALAGPFGTYESLGMLARAGFWGVMVGLSVLTGVVVRAFVHMVLGMRGLVPGTLVISAMMAVGLPPIVFGVMQILPGVAVTPPAMVELAAFVFCVTLSVGGYRHFVSARVVAQATAGAQAGDVAPNAGQTGATDQAALGTAVQPRLMLRLAEPQRGALISISVRDHYVDVTTDRGQASLLLRLSDAVLETDGCDGAQVHRSHWVAWQAVERVDRDGQRMVLRMKGGGVVPVSRSYRAMVDARGIGITRAV